jgi:hypothetical protein
VSKLKNRDSKKLENLEDLENKRRYVADNFQRRRKEDLRKIKEKRIQQKSKKGIL